MELDGKLGFLREVLDQFVFGSGHYDLTDVNITEKVNLTCLGLSFSTPKICPICASLDWCGLVAYNQGQGDLKLADDWIDW